MMSPRQAVQISEAQAIATLRKLAADGNELAVRILRDLTVPDHPFKGEGRCDACGCEDPAGLRHTSRRHLRRTT